MSSPANPRLPGQEGSGVRSGTLSRVRDVVPVASGKGGVGKSTVSVNLALALSARGSRVGLLDADVYGPSLPLLLGIHDKPLMQDGRILPVERYGLKVMSTGFFLPPNEAVIWRGPMLHKMIQDLLGAVEWGDLDTLVVDLPPGTGDVQLSLCQSVSTSGAVIVSTPQDVAWQVAQKAILMFDKLNAPVLGVIENMSYHACPHCGTREEVFGHGGARRAAERLGLPFLGQIPLETVVRSDSDAGDPTVHARPESLSAKAFFEAAQRLTAQLDARRLGGPAQPVPSRIGPAGGPRLEIEWSDGLKSSYDARRLRASCPCAACVDEFTGRKLVDPDRIDPNVRASEVRPVGRYALQIVWSDGHSTGLYSYRMLRQFASD